MQPLATVKIGKWIGRAMIDTGSTKTLVSDKIVSQIGSPVYKDEFAERVNTISGIACFDQKIRANINLLGHQAHKWNITVVKDSPAINNNEFEAIIGADLLSKLPPVLIDYQKGVLSLPRPQLKSKSNNSAPLMSVQSCSSNWWMKRNTSIRPGF